MTFLNCLKGRLNVDSKNLVLVLIFTSNQMEPYTIWTYDHTVSCVTYVTKMASMGLKSSWSFV